MNETSSGASVNLIKSVYCQEPPYSALGNSKELHFTRHWPNPRVPARLDPLRQSLHAACPAARRDDKREISCLERGGVPYTIAALYSVAKERS